MRTPTMRGSGMGAALRLAAAGLLFAGLAMPRLAAADVGSDHPAAILVFPKLLVDTTNGLDTLIRITNVSDTALNVACFYVNSTPQCPAKDGTSCFPDKQFCIENVGGQLVTPACQAKWQETDFIFRLTQDQPTGWLVSGGEGTGCSSLNGRCSNDRTTECKNDMDCGVHNQCVRPPCLPLDGILGRIGPNKQVNQGAIPLVPEDPFIGELKCIAVDESGTDTPIARNDLIGEALIGRVQAGPDRIALAGYNAIGIPAEIDNPCQPNGTCSIGGGGCQSDSDCPQSTNNRDNTLVLGGPMGTAEYEACPNVLIIDHFFDGAVDPLITNSCQPDGTCAITKTACISNQECVDNICLAGGTCSVTGTSCKGPADCNNTCITTNQCVGNTCTVGGAACKGNSDCANNVCTLSKQKCIHDGDCTDPGFRARVATDLTLVPCTEDFENQNPDLSRTVAQFLVFNEFEQRFSTSTTVDCFKETRLSNIETAQNPNSIFSVGVGGTLTGQTRILGVQSNDPQVAGKAGNGLLGVVEEFRCGGPEYQFPLCSFTDNPKAVVSATAKNLHFQGLRPVSDFIYLPRQ